MAGFTDAAMRCLSHHHGAALTYTEMVNASGLLRQSDSTWHLLEKLPGEGPLVAHLYGADPDEMAAAAEKVAALNRFVAIDLNAGCPVRKIAAKGCGAALMPHPGLIAKILRRMGDAQPLPVTLKTRLGLVPETPLAFDLLAATQDAGASAITFHARYASQFHSGPADLALLARVVERARIPVIGNGGIRNARDAFVMLRETHVAALMIGRAAMGNPWLFADVAKVFRDAAPEALPDTFEHPAPRVLYDTLLQHIDASLELHRQIHANHKIPARALPPERAVAMAFRCHLFRYLSGLRGSAHLRAGLSQYQTLDDIRDAARRCLDEHLAAHPE